MILLSFRRTIDTPYNNNMAANIPFDGNDPCPLSKDHWLGVCTWIYLRPCVGRIPFSYTFKMKIRLTLLTVIAKGGKMRDLEE